MSTDKRTIQAALSHNTDTSMRQVTVKLPVNLYNEIKKLSIDMNKQVYTAFQEALTEYLQSRRAGNHPTER